MQQTGCLKKRRRRAIAKVKGLGALPYDEAQDNYRGLDIYSSATARDFLIRKQAKEHRRSSENGRRSTSDEPLFYTNTTTTFVQIDDDEDEDDVFIRSTSSTETRRIPKKTEAALKRPIFVDYGVIWTLQSWILLGISTLSFPWSWNKKTLRIDKWSPWMEKLWKISYSIAIGQIICLTFFQFYQFIAEVALPHETYREVFMSFMSLYWYITCLNFNFNLYLHRDLTREYINALFDMNQKLCKRFVIDLEDYEDGGRIMINVSFPSNLCEPFAAAALFVVVPFKKWFLYHYIYEESNPWWYIVPGTIQEYILVGQVITSYLLISWATVAHTNSVNFWLKEIHKGADSGYTTPETSQPKTAIEIYRTLQIICTMFNDCISPMGIMMVQFNVLFGIASCGYVLIRSMNHIFIEEFPGILMYPISVLDCVTAAIAILSMSSEMFDLGVGFIDSWSRTKQKDFRRILKALPTLKVKIGHFYPITVATTITFFKACLDLVVDAVMTFP